MKWNPLILSFCLIAVSACADTAPENISDVSPASTVAFSDVHILSVRPDYSTIHAINGDEVLSLIVWSEDGTEVAVTADSWTSDDPSIAAIDASGQVTGVADGQVIIHAHYQGQEAVARVVINSQLPGGDPSVSPLPGGATGSTGSTGSGTPPGGGGPQESPPPSSSAPYADVVVSHTVGDGGGFNEDKLPGIVLGPPKGLGHYLGSYDVFSLGVGGEIVLEFTDYLAFDGSGPDFIVFENAFQLGTDPNVTFAEPGIVSVSEDGQTWVTFPCDLSGPPYAGCAGVHPTLANADTNTIDPTDPAVAGGDAFDLADVGLKVARFVKIQDSGLGLGPIGPGTRGFDLDAISIHHGTLP